MSHEITIPLSSFNWNQPRSPFPRTGPNVPASSLHAAVAQLEIEVPGAFRNGTATALITTGLGGMDDALAAGISGHFEKPNGQFAKWTVRWDWDQSKGCHVNLSLLNAGSTTKWAICDHSEPNLAGPHKQSASYYATIEKFSAAVGYQKVDKEDLVKRKKYAEVGYTNWKRAVHFDGYEEPRWTEGLRNPK